MSIQHINNTPFDSGAGDKLAVAFGKVNDNFQELLSLVNNKVDQTEFDAAVAAIEAELDAIQDELDTKSNIGHTHVVSDIIGLQTILDSLVTETEFNTVISLINQAIAVINVTLADHQNQINSKVNKSGIEQVLPILDASGSTIGGILTDGEKVGLLSSGGLRLVAPVVEASSLEGFEDYVLGVGLNGSIIPIKKDFNSYSPVVSCSLATPVTASIQVELCAMMSLTQDLIQPTVQWNVNYNNTANQDALVQLRFGLNNVPTSSTTLYQVPKNTTMALVGSAPYAGTIVSGSEITAFLTSNRNGTVNSVTLKAGSGIPVIDAVPTDGSDNTVASNGVFDALATKENLSNKKNNLNVDGTGLFYPTVDAVNDEFDYVQSTGILYGGALTVNASSSTRFDIASGSGYIISSSDLGNVTRVKVNWTSSFGHQVTNINTQLVTYVYVNANGTLHQTSTFPTDAERRARIFIGRLNHSNTASITFTDTFPDMLQGPISQYFDLTNAIGAFSYNGNVISANGANLSINKTVGKMFNASFNYLTNNQSPNTIDCAGLTLATFRHQNRATTDPTNITVIDPTTYDNGGVTTTVPNPGATATAMRVYLFPSNTIRIQRGQATYSNLADAIAGYKGEVFTENPSNTGVAVWIATICVQKNCTSLLDTTTSRIIIEPKFGGSGGAAGVTTATLQSAYNNSTVPQILTDAIRGGVTIRRGSAADTDNVIVVQNGAGSTTWSVDGNGNVNNNPLITLVATASVSASTTVNGLTQKGRVVAISNGTGSINYFMDTADGFTNAILKHGSGNITFVSASGRTMIQSNGTAILSGTTGSTATITSIGTIDYLRINNL